MRHKIRLVWIVAGALTVSASSADAQEKRVNVSFGAGYTAPNAEVRNHLGDGFNINFGVQVNATPTLGIEGLYSFNGLGQKQKSIPVSINPPDAGIPTDFFGDMNMQYGTAALVLQKPDGQVRPYGLAGMGVYYRPVKITTPGVGYIPGYCDPWWYYCVPGGFVPVENILAKRSSTDFGMVFGGGVNFNAFYTEVRYHYIWGPEVEVPTGGGTAPDLRKANGQFLAITFGLRF